MEHQLFTTNDYIINHYTSEVFQVTSIRWGCWDDFAMVTLTGSDEQEVEMKAHRKQGTTKPLWYLTDYFVATPAHIIKALDAALKSPEVHA